MTETKEQAQLDDAGRTEILFSARATTWKAAELEDAAHERLYEVAAEIGKTGATEVWSKLANGAWIYWDVKHRDKLADDGDGSLKAFWASSPHEWIPVIRGSTRDPVESEGGQRLYRAWVQLEMARAGRSVARKTLARAFAEWAISEPERKKLANAERFKGGMAHVYDNNTKVCSCGRKVVGGVCPEWIKE